MKEGYETYKSWKQENSDICGGKMNKERLKVTKQRNKTKHMKGRWKHKEKEIEKNDKRKRNIKLEGQISIPPFICSIFLY